MKNIFLNWIVGWNLYIGQLNIIFVCLFVCLLFILKYSKHLIDWRLLFLYYKEIIYNFPARFHNFMEFFLYTKS